jgi:hypothetical protein
MLRYLFPSAAFVLLPLTAFADCAASGTLMFACRPQGEPVVIEACLEGTDTVVRVRPTTGGDGTPTEVYALRPDQLELRRSAEETEFWAEIEFLTDDKTRYVLAYALVGPASAPAKVQGVLVVIDPAGVPLELGCKPGSIEAHDFAPLAEVLEAKGYAWCEETYAWEKRCG